MGNLTANENNRNYEIDLLRGLAIVLMVIFHFGYDLSIFGWAHYNTSEDIEWRIFRSIIVSGFLLAVGMSSYLAYQKSINKKKLAKTVGKLFAVSLLITIGSLIYPIWEWSVLNLGIPLQTVDLVSLFPWIGVVLIGVFVMHKEIFHIKFTASGISNKLGFLGQHSLLIYLIHQPILYGLFGLIDLILGR